MKSLISLFTVVLVFCNFTFAEQSTQYSKTTLIVKFKTGTSLLNYARNLTPKNYSDKLEFDNTYLNSSAALKDFMSRYFISSIKAVKPDATMEQLAGGIERIFIIEISNGMNIEEIRNQLSNHRQIEYAELDYFGNGGGTPYVQSSVFLTPNDPSFTQQWGLRNTGQNINGFNGTPGGDINAVNAWDITTGSASLIISILDSGMPLSHPEFSGRLLQGYDFANNDNNPTDDQGHGSNVGSITGAKGNNGSLMAGVNWNSRIIPVKILDANNSGQYSWWVSGITYAVDNGAKVLNMSVGGNSYSQSLADAVTYAFNNGRIVVCCMMNNNNNVTYYPAGFTNVIAIGAINNRMQRAVPFCWGGGSSYGSHIDFTAPGEMILGLVYNNPNTTNYWCGTSQATPIMAGIVSLLLSANSSLTYSQIYNVLRTAARDQVGPANEDTPGFDNYFGWGLVDARVALNQVIGIHQISTEIPSSFKLEQNYPNPFNPVTNIKFDVPKKSKVKLTVLNSLGQVIETLVDKELIPGTYNYDWDAAKYSSGVYFYTIKTEGFIETKKMMLIK